MKIQRARNIADTQTFGKQDPYVIAHLLPEPFPNSVDESARPRTKCVEAGDTNPIWASEHEPTLKLPLGPEGRAKRFRLVLQLWNENAALDDLIGTADLPIPDPGTALNQPAKSKFYPVDTGGDIGISLMLSDRG